jgi:hypothetical protein
MAAPPVDHTPGPYDRRAVGDPTVYDVLVAIDKIAVGRPQGWATREEIAEYLGVEADEISDEREPTLLLGQALEHNFVEEEFKSRGSWRLTIEGRGVLE